jgi:hypothetical protein
VRKDTDGRKDFVVLGLRLINPAMQNIPMSIEEAKNISGEWMEIPE